MSRMDLDKAFGLIDQYDGDFVGAKEDALIRKAESALGISFPGTYREFLSRLGCGDVEGFEVYGLVHEDFYNSSVPDAVWLTLQERKAGLPNNLVLIGSTGDGSYYALDASQVGESGEYPVLEYNINGKAIKVADDFGTFLYQELLSILS